ncbi:anthranilate synthase component I [Telmatospirillum siberiense]|uniref:Anthranilate synthase n=1 Tax=Telmatospirillum siberiense TaxID=382514 RepID=A0A2N3PRW0_9PROT|nr:anthranilate synthase component I [Telmatospirillum siberiense]PKU23143.1 anthranilate synthase component I [Telmatospirillum siberiense]
MSHYDYQTSGGIAVRRTVEDVPYPGNVAALAGRLDGRRGVLLSSGYEYPGRYTRWDIGFADPPLVLTARGRDFTIEALNDRGAVLLPAIAAALTGVDALSLTERSGRRLDGVVAKTETRFAEEMRSRQPSVFSLLRAVIDLFKSGEDHHLGLYGAFGYDLVFQFEPMDLRLPRAADQRDLVLYLPDEIHLVDHMRKTATIRRYDFSVDGRGTAGLPRETAPAPYLATPPARLPAESDHAPGEYAGQVERAREAFARGDLFEVVLGQLLSAPCAEAPSEIFHRLRRTNPAPYGTLINLGDGEFLAGASPEMFVRVEGKRVETCPISGTIRRGADAIEDAERIRELLNSAKDESELTMCTDVDRNDKSRVCEAGSVRVIGRRQIELYSRLIHTVDHVEGTLRPEFDALDGFLSHAWAVTVTGAPKRWAIRFVEQHEKSARRWYGGAIGALTFDGDMNTGLTLRTIRMKDGIAEVRVGATLLHDSDPVEEEAETRLKASAMLAVIGRQPAPARLTETAEPTRISGAQVLLIDHEDSFVHTLAGYFRAAGARVTTLRPDHARMELRNGLRPDLVVLSPGPGRPEDFDMEETLSLLIERHLPIFGVCLGLQGIVLHFGGALGILNQPMHGKPSEVRILGGRLMTGLPERFTVGRYHSLHAATMPDCLMTTAETADGTVMAIEHKTLPIAAVQFHPESVMTAAGLGRRLIEGVLSALMKERETA